MPDGTEALAYVLDGGARFGSDAARAGRDELVRFAGENGPVTVRVPTDGARTEVLLLAGPPTGEPVARSGPFVMNTMAEIREVIGRYRGGALGDIPSD